MVSSFDVVILNSTQGERDTKASKKTVRLRFSAEAVTMRYLDVNFLTYTKDRKFSQSCVIRYNFFVKYYIIYQTLYNFQVFDKC